MVTGCRPISYPPKTSVAVWREAKRSECEVQRIDTVSQVCAKRLSLFSITTTRVVKTAQAVLRWESKMYNCFLKDLRARDEVLRLFASDALSVRAWNFAMSGANEALRLDIFGLGGMAGEW